MSMYPNLHNAMWPGLVGKEEGSDHPPISLDCMLDLTVGAKAGDQKFDGVDLFLFHPHIDPDADDDALNAIADNIAGRGLVIGSLVAPVWEPTGGGSAMGNEAQRKKFIAAVRNACRIAKVFNENGVRQYGVIRIDSADSPANWAKDPAGNTKKIAATFHEAAVVAEGYGERLAVEGEVSWGGMHSWRQMVRLLEAVDMPEVVGFLADMGHILTFLLGINAPEDKLLDEDFNREQLVAAWQTAVEALRPWMFDFHVAQSDGTIRGTGSHDATGKHCPVDDPNGKLDIVADAGPWLLNAKEGSLSHICWDGCMFPNELLEQQETWNKILGAMVQVRNAHGWQE